jgi:hypothetical protein
MRTAYTQPGQQFEIVHIFYRLINSHRHSNPSSHGSMVLYSIDLQNFKKKAGNMVNHIEYHIIFHIKVGKRYDSTRVSQAPCVTIVVVGTKEDYPLRNTGGKTTT